MQQWHLLYTNPRQEALVDHQLMERGLETYCPYLRIERGYGRGIRREPFFPHYLFVHVDLSSRRAADLRWMPGVRSIVSFADEPVVVPASLIADLRQRLAVSGKQRVHTPATQFTPGQRLKVRSGPFEGYEAIFQSGLDGHERVLVLLDVLGRQTKTELRANQLTALYS